MAHTKAKGSTKLGRESESKRLGVKLFDGQAVAAGQIIIRQRGTKYYPGTNVKRSGDDTLYALTNGVIKFTTRRKTNYGGTRRLVKAVHVIPLGLAEERK